VPTIHSEYMREEQARACACVQASRRGEFVSNCSASLFLYAGTYWRRTCTHTSTHARARAQIHTHQREYAVRTHAYIQEIGCASPLLDSATPSPRIGETQWSPGHTDLWSFPPARTRALAGSGSIRGGLVIDCIREHLRVLPRKRFVRVAARQSARSRPRHRAAPAPHPLRIRGAPTHARPGYHSS